MQTECDQSRLVIIYKLFVIIIEVFFSIRCDHSCKYEIFFVFFLLWNFSFKHIGSHINNTVVRAKVYISYSLLCSRFLNIPFPIFDPLLKPSYSHNSTMSSSMEKKTSKPSIIPEEKSPRPTTAENEVSVVETDEKPKEKDSVQNAIDVSLLLPLFPISNCQF